MRKLKKVEQGYQYIKMLKRIPCDLNQLGNGPSNKDGIL